MEAVKKQSKSEAMVVTLLEAGCKRERKEDREGKTRSGWWQEDVYLAPGNDPAAALRALQGN